MPSIQVKGVPDEVHATLRRRAATAGKSLQEYLLDQLVAGASTPTLEELFERVSSRTGGDANFVSAVATVRAERDNL